MKKFPVTLLATQSDAALFTYFASFHRRHLNVHSAVLQSMHVDFEDGGGCRQNSDHSDEEAAEEPEARDDDEQEPSRPASEQAVSEPESEPVINPVLAQLLHDDNQRFELGVEEVSGRADDNQRFELGVEEVSGRTDDNQRFELGVEEVIKLTTTSAFGTDDVILL